MQCFSAVTPQEESSRRPRQGLGADSASGGVGRQGAVGLLLPVRTHLQRHVHQLRLLRQPQQRPGLLLVRPRFLWDRGIFVRLLYYVARSSPNCQPPSLIQQCCCSLTPQVWEGLRDRADASLGHQRRGPPDGGRPGIRNVY